MYVITGVSKGLGKAIVEQLLDAEESVIGIGRTNSIEHKNYQFIECDLSVKNAVHSLSLDLMDEEVVLINNAGIIGDINRLSQQESLDLNTIMQVNTIAPMELAHKLYSQTTNKQEFSLINISSGAANKSIPSWGAYCASKAALNMLTESFYLEEVELGNHPTVMAISPGVIDTDMQVNIRSTSEKNFSAVQNFIAMKEGNDLFSPKEAARRLLNLINLPFKKQVFHDLRTVKP